MANIAVTEWHWSFAEAVLFTALLGFVAAARARLGLASRQRDRVRDGHARVRAGRRGARAQGSASLDARRGGARRRLPRSCPTSFVGIVNTKHLYWLALGYLAVVFFIVRWAVESSPGRVWQAIRENELRVEVLGLRPRAYKLMSFVLASFLATIGGIVYLLLFNSSSPGVTAPNFTLSLLLMVVIGGAGTRWGAVLGGVLYTYLDNRLGALGDSSAVQDLPKVLRTPLEQPLFLLGTIFILIVFFLPGGIAGLAARGRPARPAQARAGACGREAPSATRRALTEPQERHERDRLDGVRLAYEVQGAGEPLLLVQGLGYGRSRLGAGARAARGRFHVVSYDSRGFGESDAPPGPYTTAQLAEDAVGVLDAADVERAHVVGISLGGMVAQELALRSRIACARSCSARRRPEARRRFRCPSRRSR